MAHFAKIENNTVTMVIVAEQEFINTIDGTWVQTSYNTYGGIHYGPDGQPDGGTPLRANYAGIGYTYDDILDVFYAPKINDLYQLNNVSFTWELKPEYSPLITAVMQSPLLILPTGVVDDSIDIDGTIIRNGQNVLFPNLTADSGVYKYTSLTGTFTPVLNNTLSVVVVGDDYSTVYRYVNTAWVSEAVQP